MRRLLNPLTHTVARPATTLRTPLFQVQQVRNFAKRGPKKVTKKAAAAAPKAAAAAPKAAASAASDVDRIAAIAASTNGIPTLPRSHVSSLTGYQGVAARALWNGAAEHGAEGLAALEQEITNINNTINNPSASDVAEFAKGIDQGFPDYLNRKELGSLRRQVLEDEVRHAIRKTGPRPETEPDMEDTFKLSPVLKASLVEIMTGKKFKKLDLIFTEFMQLMDVYKGITRATVTVAQPMTPEQTALVEKFIAADVGADQEIALTVDVDPSIIAGMQIQVGERMWNMAASHHLTSAKKKLHASMSGKAWQFDNGKMFADA